MEENGHKETPYENLKNLQHAIRLERGRKPPITDLIVLAPNNDPFYSGTEGQEAIARWLAALWERFGYSNGVHLRRIHYRIVGVGNITKPDGSLYENDKKSWAILGDAARHARYLGLLDPENLVDKRNPIPHVYLNPSAGVEPGWSYEAECDDLARIRAPLDNSWRDLVPEVSASVEGYFYEDALQPYHVEVWAEKTTMDDILVPLCRDAGVNYVSGAGYQSVTAAVKLLRERVQMMNKPCRVLYVSDYDDAGRNMPRQIARQLEFWVDHYGMDIDLRVEPLVMTAEQAAKYPEDPETGAVELDAMEALDPGLLESKVTEALDQFRDGRLLEQVEELGEQVQERVEEAIEEVVSEAAEPVEQIKAEAEEIYERYRPELEDLAARMGAELEPLDERLQTVQRCHHRKTRRT